MIAAEELAENSNVQDAFVIAVEQQARERLERLSALRKIKPVDMTTLSQQVTHIRFSLKTKYFLMDFISMIKIIRLLLGSFKILILNIKTIFFTI